MMITRRKRELTVINDTSSVMSSFGIDRGKNIGCTKISNVDA